MTCDFHSQLVMYPVQTSTLPGCDTQLCMLVTAASGFIHARPGLSPPAVSWKLLLALLTFFNF